ncbi:hypothetical protein ACWE42_13700 [Sutcliffiella cohnii]|uniref:hypothetical protein n=1 Tax=Sutcliffiella cohnii TaxID=33932 RepID=UPI002E1C34F5|nr:hypothetical protein [Sutcliffiella cohnii]
MKKLFILFFVIGFSLVGCSQEPKNEISEPEVKKTIDENVQGDFVFRLVSEKKEYGDGENVKLYGEITYTGDKDEVTITHSSSAILFSLEEKGRGFNIGYSVEDIELVTVLKKGEPYREEYVKSGGYDAGDPSDYVRFIKRFLNNEGFPSGYYIVNGETDFFLKDKERVNIKATINFKVVE